MYTGDPFDFSDLIQNAQDDFHQRVFAQMYRIEEEANRKKIYSRINLTPTWLNPHCRSGGFNKKILILANNHKEVYLSNSSLRDDVLVSYEYEEVQDFQNDFDYTSYLVPYAQGRNNRNLTYLPVFLKQLKTSLRGEHREGVKNDPRFDRWNKVMLHDWSYLGSTTISA